MKSYSLSHVQDSILLRDLAAIVARDHATTATLLAHIAEVDARRLYAGEGYSSMFVYCLDELHLSEDAAYKRIQAARAGRQFPALFHALEEGRLHLAAICLLAPHLTPENVEDLIEAATRRRKSEIEHLLAQRFPELGAPPVRALIRALPVRPIPAPTIDPLGQVDAFHTTDDDAVPSAVPESQGSWRPLLAGMSYRNVLLNLPRGKLSTVLQARQRPLSDSSSVSRLRRPPMTSYGMLKRC